MKSKSIRHEIITFFIAAFVLSAVTVKGASSDGVTYTREWLRNEQTEAQTFLSSANKWADSAERLLDGKLVLESAEELVRANFFLDLAEARLNEHPARIARLRSSAFSYVKGEEQRRLTASFDVLHLQLREFQQRVSHLHQRSVLQDDAPIMVQMYLLQRDHYRERIRQGLNDADVVVRESRQLARFPLELVRAGVVHSGNVDRCRISEDGSVVLPDGKKLHVGTSVPREKIDPGEGQRLGKLESATGTLVEEMRMLREHAATNRPVIVTNFTISVTNTVAPTTTAILDKPERLLPKRPDSETVEVPAAALSAPAASDAPESASSKLSSSGASDSGQTQAVLNRRREQAEVNAKPLVEAKPLPAPALVKPKVAAPADGELASRDQTNAGAMAKLVQPPESSLGVSATSGEPEQEATSVSATESRQVKPLSRPVLFSLGVVGVLALCALGAIGLARVTQRRFDVTVATVHPDGTATPKTLTLDPKAEQIILGKGDPRVEPSDLQQSIQAAITLDWFGRASVRTGSGRVSIGDAEIETDVARVRAGDEIKITHRDSKAIETYAIREITIAARDVVELEEAAQTIN